MLPPQKILHRNMGSQKIQVMDDSRLVNGDDSLLEPIDLQLTVFETLLQEYITSVFTVVVAH